MVLRDLLRARANESPGRLAFAYHGEELTYAELAHRATARAVALESIGVDHGDRVAIAMSVGLPLVEVFWALQLIGATPAVFNPSAPADTLARRIELVRPRLVLTDELVDEIGSSPGEPAQTDVGPDDLAFLQLTSGTSGAPRASMILHRNAIAYLRTCRSAQVIGGSDVLVSWVPPWHDLGLVRFVIATVYHGASCHIVEPSVKTIPEWLRTIARVGGTYSAAPDFAFRLAARMVDPATVDLSSLRFLKSGGEPVRWSSITLFEERFGVAGVTIPGYGLGEVTLGVSEHIPGEEIPVDERGTVSCGPVNASLEVRAGESIDSPDEIVVKGEAVFAGYFDAPDETDRVLRDGWLHTGDSGYFDDAGRLFVLGRRAGMIKRAGAVVSPRELEEAAERVAGVRVAAATSLPSERLDGDLVVVAIETDGGDRADERIAAEVSREIAARVGFAPGRVSVLPRRTIPRTENGKVRHGELRALLGRSTATSP